MKPGIAYGQTDELGYEAVENPMHVHDLHATILHLLGLDHERLTYRYAGRHAADRREGGRPQGDPRVTHQFVADCLGVAAEETGDVLNPTVAQLRSLNRRIAPPILLSQGIEQSLHHALDLRPVGVHAILLMLHSVSPAG